MSGGCIFCKSRHWSVSTWRLKSGFFCSMSRNTIKQFYCKRRWAGRVAETTSRFFCHCRRRFSLPLYCLEILLSCLSVGYRLRGYATSRYREKPLRFEKTLFVWGKMLFLINTGSLCVDKRKIQHFILSRKMSRWLNSFKLPSLFTCGRYGNRQLSIFVIWDLPMNIEMGKSFHFVKYKIIWSNWGIRTLNKMVIITLINWFHCQIYF